MPLTASAAAASLTLCCAECKREMDAPDAFELQRLSPEGELILEDLCPDCVQQWKLKGGEGGPK